MSKSDYTRFAADPLGFIRSLTIPTRFGPRRFSTVMQPHQRKRLKGLAPDLVAIARGEQPPCGKHWWETSKGTSKTSDVACVVIWLCVFASKPLNMLAAAVDRDNAAELIKSAKAIVHENTWLNELVDVQAWAIAGRHTAAVCEVVAADKKGSHGSKPALTFIDECGHVPDDRWEFVSNLLDNASKVAGVTICATNAGWTDTEAYKLRELVRTSERWQFHQWAEPSPLMDLREVEEAKLRNSPSRFLRLFHGVWGPRDEGDAIDPHHIQQCITLAGPTPVLPSGWRLPVLGVDAGFKHDRTGCAVVAIDGLCRASLLETKSWTPRPGSEVQIEDIEQYILDAHRRYRFIQVCVDPYGMQGSMQRLAACGVPIRVINPTNANADEVARRIPVAFRDKHIALYPCDELLSDLSKFSIVEKVVPGFTDGASRLNAQRDSSGHADLGVAWLMACTLALNYADALRTQQTITAMQEQQERAKTGGRDRHWGAPVGRPGMYDSPYPDIATEFGYRKPQPAAMPSIPPIKPWYPGAA